jgi:hypothetical protein
MRTRGEQLNAIPEARGYTVRPISRADRRDSAQNVSVALAQLPLTQLGAPTTNRFS